MSARIRLLVALIAIALLATGCGPTFGDLPLPGNGVGGDTVTVKVQFDEALNLAEGAAVKVNGVASGKVESVSAKDFKAIAVMKVNKAAKMRSDATARLRYTTPLGELFVDITNPAQGTLLRDGEMLDPARSTTAPTVEDALSSASLLVNGGGLNQLQTVTDQLNKAIGGREDEVRTLLARSDTFLTQANATTGDIDRALRALAGVSVVLNRNRGVIREALTDIRPAAKVLRQNTPGLTRFLAKLAEFSSTANHVVGQTRAEILQMFREVSPVLQEFLNVRGDFGPSLNDLVGIGKALNTAIPGDYANMRLELQLAGVTLPNLLGTGGGGSTGANGNGTGGLPGTSSTSGSSNPLGDLLGGLLGGLTGGGTAGKTAPRVLPSQQSDSPLSFSALVGGGR
jgi:phospholipid/cholesterol/gamma-HCH transport system substrate-binding protein